MSRAALRGAALGAVHGVLEWLPVSSSGHAALLIELAGWPEARPEQRRARRALEVALHAGSIPPLAGRVWSDVTPTARGAVAREALLASAVTAIVGQAAGPWVERRLSGPRSVAGGLAAGSALLLLAEIAGPRLPARQLGELGAGRAALVGAVQGIAIVPGVSRRASSLAASRLAGLAPADAATFSWAAGLPTLAGATAWQFTRARAELRAAPAAPLAGAAASLAAGQLSRKLPHRTARWPAAAWAGWRLALAAATLRRARHR